ncbi:polymorphic toxin type 17 domain-containing protein, partial [Asaia astilbis]|uniref:polymorphic toxin type 17 domain-containing protein n=1 Tax=Asaia astilbis TaxID=610244 RepID=UPI000561BF7E
ADTINGEPQAADHTQKQDEAKSQNPPEKDPEKKGGENSTDDRTDSPPSKKGRIKDAGLPTEGKIRFVPPKWWKPSENLPKKGGAFRDKFNNLWKKGPSRTAGEPYEWDVQLSPQGKKQLGWATRDGSHANVSLDGKITHK